MGMLDWIVERGDSLGDLQGENSRLYKKNFRKNFHNEVNFLKKNYITINYDKTTIVTWYELSNERRGLCGWEGNVSIKKRGKEMVELSSFFFWNWLRKALFFFLFFVYLFIALYSF